MKPITFIIITYNRPDDTLELLQNLAQLEKKDELLEKIIVVNNASSAAYSQVEAYIQSNTTTPFTFINAPENYGVTKGRNFALQFAESEIIIFLDDDAVLQNNDALVNVMASFDDKGLDGRETAIVSFKVLYYSNLEMQVNALPHKKFNQYKNNSQFYTYYFAGGAHAIKRKVLQQAGNLPEEFFYGMEEYDLSYRVLDLGYCIKYDASIVMLHKESPLGRKPKKEKLMMMWLNKTIVAWRYLPKRFFYTTACMWGVEYLLKTKFNIGGFFKGWQKVFAVPANNPRVPVKKTTMAYLKKVQARLWY